MGNMEEENPFDAPHAPQPDQTNIAIEGLKKLYKEKIAPLEKLTLFDEFYSPILKDSDIEAKPSILLLGQYSTGKTTFIRHLIGRDFPGSQIGPEPTTDKFLAIYHGKDELITPGNALAVQADREFRGLSQFGINFLNRFQGSQLPAPILKDLTLIDTPGVLSGENQRINRGYDFVKVCEWFAEKCDLILLLFDAHKLDISDEFKRTIAVLARQTDKVRVILNKADAVNNQQLMRVYGALMWSLGKVLQTPEVCRVYIGSFWDQPYINAENEKLFEAEKTDLLSEIHSLPNQSAVRKINEIVKRTRLLRVHTHIVAKLRQEMPALFGKDSKKNELLANLKDVFFQLHKQHRLPVGDFPPIARFRDQARHYDFYKFPKLPQKMLESLEQVLSEDIPVLMKQCGEIMREKEQETNPFEMQ